MFGRAAVCLFLVSANLQIFPKAQIKMDVSLFQVLTLLPAFNPHFWFLYKSNFAYQLAQFWVKARRCCRAAVVILSGAVNRWSVGQ